MEKKADKPPKRTVELTNASLMPLDEIEKKIIEGSFSHQATLEKLRKRYAEIEVKLAGLRSNMLKAQMELEKIDGDFMVQLSDRTSIISGLSKIPAMCLALGTRVEEFGVRIKSLKQIITAIEGKPEPKAQTRAYTDKSKALNKRLNTMKEHGMKVLADLKAVKREKFCNEKCVGHMQESETDMDNSLAKAARLTGDNDRLEEELGLPDNITEQDIGEKDTERAQVNQMFEQRLVQKKRHLSESADEANHKEDLVKLIQSKKLKIQESEARNNEQKTALEEIRKEVSAAEDQTMGITLKIEQERKDFESKLLKIKSETDITAGRLTEARCDSDRLSAAFEAEGAQLAHVCEDYKRVLESIRIIDNETDKVTQSQDDVQEELEKLAAQFRVQLAGARQALLECQKDACGVEEIASRKAIVQQFQAELDKAKTAVSEQERVLQDIYLTMDQIELSKEDFDLLGDPDEGLAHLMLLRRLVATREEERRVERAAFEKMQRDLEDRKMRLDADAGERRNSVQKLHDTLSSTRDKKALLEKELADISRYVAMKRERAIPPQAPVSQDSSESEIAQSSEEVHSKKRFFTQNRKAKPNPKLDYIVKKTPIAPMKRAPERKRKSAIDSSMAVIPKSSSGRRLYKPPAYDAYTLSD